MARAHPLASTPAATAEPQQGDWQALRGELVALLEQVEGQYAETGSANPAFAGFAQRMRDLRFQVADDIAPEVRQREALRSVKRQVDRFHERAEAEPAPLGDAVLQSAIQQIRARTQAPAAAFAAPPPAAPAPRFDQFSQAVSGLSGRLEQLEAELRTQRGNTAQVREIADQVSQLTQVVELLAGAVGETGQVKRLEAQIAGLAHLIGEGPRVDLGQLTERLDQVAATVDRLADLQVQQIQHVVREAEETPHKDGEAARSLAAIETGVRNIYDRIDTLESTVALPPDELERISGMLGQISHKLGNEAARPDSLLGLVDALNGRINEIEDRGETLSGLKADIGQLRDSVIGAIEPRFAAIETQLGALGERLGQRDAAATGLAPLEAQIRQLVARMDQTGEQLSGLAALYTEARPSPDFEDIAERAAAHAFAAMARHETPNPLGDLNALADLVATRTAEAVGQAPALPSTPVHAGLSEANLGEIEQRIGRLVEGFLKASAADGAGAGVRDGIDRVAERLALIEAALGRPAPASARAPHAIAALASEPAATAAEADGADDAMPHNPGEDAPLREFGFSDLGPVRAALGNRQRRGQAATALDAGTATSTDSLAPPTAPLAGGSAPRPPAGMPGPGFDPALVERPPRPTSSLEREADDAFAAAAAAPAAPVSLPVTTSSRNTFIEAARRAAQRQNATPAGNADSLIGRALSRFQPGPGAGTPATPEAVPDAAVPARKQKAKGKVEATADAAPAKPARRGLLSRRPKPAPLEAAAAPTPSTAEPLAEPAAGLVAEPRAAATESFLVRHRRPILIAASLIAVSFMTLNLVMQRLSAPEGDTGAATSTAAPAVAPTPTPAPTPPATPPAPTPKPAAALLSAPASSATVAAIPLSATYAHRDSAIDPMPTAAIGTPGLNYAATPGPEPLPAALAATNSAAPAAPVGLEPLTASIDEATVTPPPALDSPVTVELPPETVGPLDLRQAAADGDARAQFEVAAIYSEGRAVPQDYKAAATWYERAAAQGFVPAQYRLGNLYENGTGLTKDYEQARLWYQRAAEAGNRMAMHNLAALYAGGQFGKQDFLAAATWFRQAADRGMKDSQFNLGMLYARGLGVPQSLDDSYKWFGLAAATGDADAAKARDNIGRSLDAAAIKHATAEIAAWKPVAMDLAANFAPIGTWEKNFNPGPAITGKDVVLKVQTALKRLGFDVGTPDGQVGTRTTLAIKAFERGTGMTEIGSINPRLLAVLGSQPV